VRGETQSVRAVKGNTRRERERRKRKGNKDAEECELKEVWSDVSKHTQSLGVVLLASITDVVVFVKCEKKLLLRVGVFCAPF